MTLGFGVCVSHSLAQGPLVLAGSRTLLSPALYTLGLPFSGLRDLPWLALAAIHTLREAPPHNLSSLGYRLQGGGSGNLESKF